MDYEKAYKEALERAKNIKSKILQSHLSTESCKAVSEYIDEIIPELAESEDKKIRKKCIELIKRVVPSGDSQSQESKDILDCIAYLEKQKEPTTEELYAEAGTTEKEYIANTMKMVRAMREKKKEQKHYIEICPHSIKSRSYKENGYPIEQKPAEKQDYSGLNDLERAILRGFLSAGVENVPVTIIKETAQECLAQMKPAEWSKEDEMYLSQAIETLEHENYSILADKLKSLRPSWKPSEEQMKALEECGECKRCIKELYEQLKKL